MPKHACRPSGSVDSDCYHAHRLRASHPHPPPVAAPDILFNKDPSDKLLEMPMPPDTLKTLQDLEITGAGARGSEQQQQDDNTQHYEPTIENDGYAQGQQQQPAQTIHHHPHPSTAPHSAALQAHPSEQPHHTHIYPPLLDHQFAFDSDGTLRVPIDPDLLDARFDHPAASGHGGGGVPGFHQGHPEHQWAGAPQPLSSVNMDSLTVSPTSLSQYNDPQAPLMPGMSSFEPQISTTWSMDGSLPSTSTSRGPTMSSSISVPSNSTPASSRSPGSPGKIGSRLNSLPPSAGKDFSLTNYSGGQIEPRAGAQPSKRRRQTVGPKTTGKTSTEQMRSHRNNSSPGFSTPQVPIAPAPITVTATGDDNNKSLNNRKDSSSNNDNSSKHAEKTMTTTTAAAPTTAITTTMSNPGGPSVQPQLGPSTIATATTTALGQAPDPRARNREAANRCRAKSRVAVAELEATERALGSEHEHLTQTARHLRDEVLSLKTELLMHGNCDDELIQQYLTNSARMVGSGATTLGSAAGITATTTMPPGPLLGGVGGSLAPSSSRTMMPAASPPRALPTILPSTSSGGPGAVPSPTTTTTTTARGRGSVGGRNT